MINKIINLDDITTVQGKKYLEDILRDILIGLNHIETGTYEGTGASIVITTQGRPELVEIFFIDGGGTSVWVHDDIDPASNYHGDTGVAGADYNITISDTGFTATGSQLIVNGETFYYRVIKYKKPVDEI